MFRRVMAIGALGIALALLQSADTKANRLCPTPGGWTCFHGSTNCQVTVEELGAAQKAGISCEFTVTELQSACWNPQSKETLPGKSYYGPPKKIRGTALLEPDGSGGFGKKGKKNTASGHVRFDELDFFTSAELCPNGNWILVGVLPIRLEFTNTVFACVASGNTPCSTTTPADIVVGTCTLPSGYSLGTNPPPVGTEYECIEDESQHWHNENL